MDLTKLFLGDALEGIDLGGLNKLGFKMMEGFDNEDQSKDRTEDGDAKDNELLSDSDNEHEETKRQQNEVYHGLPPTLYTLPNGNKVYELSSLFVPEKASSEIREKMHLYNNAIIKEDLCRIPQPLFIKQEWIEKRKQFHSDMHKARKDFEMHMGSESALNQAMSDYNLLTGKRTYSQAMMTQLDSHIETVPIREPSHQLPAKRMRVQEGVRISEKVEEEFNLTVDVNKTEQIEGASIAELKNSFGKQVTRHKIVPYKPAKPLTEMSPEDRFKLKRKIKRHIEAKINEVLPRKYQRNISDPLKQCYMFMQSFVADELKPFPPRRQSQTIKNNSKVAVKLNQNNNAMQEFLSGQKMPLFQGASDDELINSASSLGEDMMLSQPPDLFPDDQLMSQDSKTSEVDQQQVRKVALPSDAQICKWMAEANQDASQQRYWGETLTCPSIYQLRRDSIQSQSKSQKVVFKIIHPSAKHSGDYQERDESLTEDQEIQRIKDQIRVKLPLTQSNEVAEIIEATERLHRGQSQSFDHLASNQMSETQVDMEMKDNTTEQNIDFQENLDVSFNKNIHEAFRLFQTKKKNKSQQSNDEATRLSENNHYSGEERQSQIENRGESSSITNNQQELQLLEHSNQSVQQTKKYNVEIIHAKCVDDLQFTAFEWTQSDLKLLHRPNIQPYFQSGTIGLRMMPNDEKYNRKRLISSEQYFKDKTKLSVKKGEFCLFEHFDKDPLFINNFGMATQINQFVYHQGVKASLALLDTLPHLGPYGNQILRKPQGQIPLIAQINQNSILDQAPLRGLTIAENKLYKAPIFYSNIENNDIFFFCSIQKGKGQAPAQIFIRALSNMFTVGQQEPKQEVLCPYGRPWYNFNRQRAQTFIYKALKNSQFFSLNDAFKMFPKFGEQGLKKMLKDAGIEVDRDQNLYAASDRMASLALADNEAQTEHQEFSQLTLEQVCQYESALKAQQELEEMGLSLAKYLLVDKISAAANRFCADEKSARVRQICRFIEDSVVVAPWNLTSNFQSCRNRGDMLLLEGVGDPSNGHGGYSFLKMPLKVQTDQCMAKAKGQRATINPAIRNPKQVTGTDADLRKLTKSGIKQKLQELGTFSNDELSRMSRWEMVSLLKDYSQQAFEQSMERPSSDQTQQPIDSQTVENLKFIRGERMTTKMQREVYQFKVNEIFRRQIAYHLSENQVQDQAQDSELEESMQVDEYNEPSSLQLQDNSENQRREEMDLLNQHQCIFNDGRNRKIKNLKKLPGFEKLLAHKIAQAQQQTTLALFSADQIRSMIKSGEIDMKCRILKRTIRSVEDGSLKVVYCADEKLIQKFLKRKKSKKAKTHVLKARQSQAHHIMSLTDISRIHHLKQQQESQQEDFKNQQQKQTLNDQSRNSNQSVISFPSIKISNNGAINDIASDKGKITIRNNDSSSQQVMQTKISIPITKSPQKKLQEASQTLKGSKKKPSGGSRQQQRSNSSRMHVSSDSEDNEQLPYASRSRSKKKTPSRQQSCNKKRQMAQEEDENDFYFQGAAARKENAANRRRNEPSQLYVFNKHLEDVIDACVKADLNRIFTQRVKVKEAPNYFDIVKDPIDLSVMKGKVKRRAYIDLPMFKKDLELMWQNSITYNGSGHIVTKFAKDLENIAMKIIAEKKLTQFELQI